MSGGACGRFKQNAWKKDLCSNCYKPKDEHQAPTPKVYPNLPLIPASQGILKGGNKKKNKKSVNVSFPEEESEVIGYGGDADSSDDDDDYDFLMHKSEDEGSEETGGEEEEEKALKQLTKSNTDFNSVLKNLNGVAEKPPSVGLLLGQQQKQTLLVTVQPFSSSPGPPPGRKSQEHVVVAEETVKCQVVAETVEVKIVQEEREKKEPMRLEVEETVVAVKSVLIETEPPAKETPKEETRANPEGRKVHITRGTVITKNHEHVKNKLYIQSVLQNKTENKRNSLLQERKSEVEYNQTVIVTCPSVEKNNAKNLLDSPEIVPDTPLREPVKEEVTVKVLKLLDGEGGPAESREMAGEPDGKADSDDLETPLNPPPRASFLHRETSISSPVTVTETKCSTPTNDSIVLEPMNRSMKRPAPKPPSIPDYTAETRGKPEEPSTPKPKQVNVEDEGKQKLVTPPRRESPPVIHEHRLTPVEKKKALRMKTTLKKLLRFGAREEEGREEAPPRPRPHIIHPLDLNKSAVQVLSSHPPGKSSPESPSSPSSPTAMFPVRPTKPPPPPRSESLNLMERLRVTGNCDNIYANLGEARSGIAPIKPQRTGSLRESKNKQNQIQSDSENLYECVGVSSAPECDMEQRSLPYYGSETESDIYYPNITFQSREPKTRPKKRGRSIVHSSLEENYGAVVVANHEALTQLLNQLLQRNQDDLKMIPSNNNLRWEDFTFPTTSESTKINEAIFLRGIFRNIPVTVAVSLGEIKNLEPLGIMALFKDTVPCAYLGKQGNALLTAHVGVLRRMNIELLPEYGKRLDGNLDSIREGALALLQVVQHLKKSEGNVSLNNFVVVSDNNDAGPNVFYLPIKEKEGSTPEECLKEGSRSLIGSAGVGDTVATCGIVDAVWVIQSWLWGPSSPLPLSALKRWLDLERANALHSLVCAKNLPTYDREHLRFLVGIDADLLAKTSRLIHLNTQSS